MHSSLGRNCISCFECIKLFCWCICIMSTLDHAIKINVYMWLFDCWEGILSFFWCYTRCKVFGWFGLDFLYMLYQLRQSKVRHGFCHFSSFLHALPFFIFQWMRWDHIDCGIVWPWFHMNKAIWTKLLRAYRFWILDLPCWMLILLFSYFPLESTKSR